MYNELFNIGKKISKICRRCLSEYHHPDGALTCLQKVH